MLDMLVILDDTGWDYATTARPDRGLHDYQRIIVFNRDLTQTELELLKSEYDKDKNTPYHYGGFFITKIAGRSYRLSCSCDSS